MSKLYIYRGDVKDVDGDGELNPSEASNVIIMKGLCYGKVL